MNVSNNGPDRSGSNAIALDRTSIILPCPKIRINTRVCTEPARSKPLEFYSEEREERKKMSIDDVQYLKDNGATDSIMLFVDSSKRDYVFYPSPSEYVVRFNEPIRMVTGLEILDGTIPSTMYNIDTFNNMLKIYLFDEDDIDTGSYKGLTLQHIFAELGIVARIFRYLDRQMDKDILVVSGGQYDHAVDDGFEPLEYDDPEQNELSSPAIILVRRLYHPNIISVGVGRFRNNPEYTIVDFRGPLTFNPNRSGTERVRENDEFVQDFTFAIRNDEPARDVLLNDMRMCIIDRKPDGVIEVIHYKPIETKIGSLESYTSSINDYRYQVHIRCRFNFMRIGNYKIEILQDRLDSDLEPLGFQVTPPREDEDADFTFKLQFTNDTRFLIDFDGSTMRDVLGYDSLAGVSNNPSQLEQVGDGRTTNEGLFRYERFIFRNKFRMYGSVFNPGRNRWSLISPGIINLSGERYATLRCKEIEEHMNQFDVENHNNNGIGTFKLASGNQITFVRFDFMSLSRRPFHPIGKLDRLTFRFERRDGGIYDFKGINHQMLINIKHLVTEQRMKFEGSVLNPSYNPDILSYGLARTNYRVEEEAQGGMREALQDGSYADEADVALMRAMGGGGAHQFDAPRVDDREFDYSSDDSFEDDDEVTIGQQHLRGGRSHRPPLLEQENVDDGDDVSSSASHSSSSMSSSSSSADLSTHTTYKWSSATY